MDNFYSSTLFYNCDVCVNFFWTFYPYLRTNSNPIFSVSKQKKYGCPNITELYYLIFSNLQKNNAIYFPPPPYDQRGEEYQVIYVAPAAGEYSAWENLEGS